MTQGEARELDNALLDCLRCGDETALADFFGEHRELDRLEESQTILTRSIEAVRAVAEQQTTQLAPVEQLAECYRSLAETLSRRGESQLAAAASQSAQDWQSAARSLGPPPERNRPPSPDGRQR